ncbi:hypothetical protein RNZ50_08795 [Paracoccaceae bacterium Fryx2]|nr:hypothetical protein [Paracoccaceae bacterium Fryx2]
MERLVRVDGRQDLRRAIENARHDLSEIERPGIIELRKDDCDDIFGENHEGDNGVVTRFRMTVADLRALLRAAERIEGNHA